MTQKTREELVIAGQKLFAEKGFYGASIARISSELGVTKQALLHHFPSKEKLYGEVLKRISDELLGQIKDVKVQNSDPRARFESVFLDLAAHGETSNDGAKIIMRELLDNVDRADKAKAWYLREYLNSLIELARAVPGNEKRSDAELLAAVYQLLGAVNYFSLSLTTLQHIFGEKTLKQTKAAFPAELRRCIESALSPS